MDTSSLTKKRTVNFFNYIFARLLPASITRQVLLWTFTSFTFLLLSLGVAYLSPSCLTPYFPLAAIGSVFVCFYWRGAGVAATYLFLAMMLLFFYKQIPVEFRLWHVGIIFSIALNSFITLLSIEEVESLIDGFVEEIHLKREETEKVSNTLHDAEKKWADEKMTLEQEIERWKEEAEQRRIEEITSSRQAMLVQSEIEILTQHKKELLENSFNARKLASERLERLEEQIEEAGRLSDLLQKIEEEKKELEKQVLELTQISHTGHLEAPQEKETPLETRLEKSAVCDKELINLEHSLAQSEGLYNQLRLQFDEKSRILSQTRKELFQTQGKLLALEKDFEHQTLDPDRKEALTLISLLKRFEQEFNSVKEELYTLEELVSVLLANDSKN